MSLPTPVSSSSSSSSWPSFNDIMSTAKAATDKEEEEKPMVFAAAQPDISMMDYSWNEDNIKIDFMTGKTRGSSGKFRQILYSVLTTDRLLEIIVQ